MGLCSREPKQSLGRGLPTPPGGLSTTRVSAAGQKKGAGDWMSGKRGKPSHEGAGGHTMSDPTHGYYKKGKEWVRGIARKRIQERLAPRGSLLLGFGDAW